MEQDQYEMKQDRNLPKVSIISSVGQALVGICRQNEVKTQIIKPKEIAWQQRKQMRRIPRTGK